MFSKSAFGRKVLNALLRHIAFHGRIEMPWRGEFEHAVVSQLVADRKVVIRKGSYHDNDIVVNINAMPYEESVADMFEPVEPLVAYLALDNPRNEELAKAFRKNHPVPEFIQPEYVPEGWDYV